jgi:hypothetical protein
MEGDVNYAKLKAIENGAAVYFTLSYQNTQILKEDENLSQYYSIRYDIWFDDVVEIYNELNRELQDVQNKLIVDHQFLAGIRVPDSSELDRDITEEFEAVLDYQINKTEYEEKQKSEAVADARDKIASVEVAAEKFVKDYVTYYSGISGAAYMYVTGDRSFQRRLASYTEAKASYDAILVEYEAADDARKAELKGALTNAEATEKQALGQLRTYIRNVGRAIQIVENQYNALSKLHQDALSGALLINSTEGCPQSIIDEIEIQLAATEKLLKEEMGVKFDMTVDKAEVDTFFRTHISTLIFSAYGDANHASAGIVGKAENLYKMLAAKEYGLLISELELLRYLDANKNLTDDELVAKYGLSADKSSVDGLVQYVKELLGEKYTFDPIVANLENGIEDNILDYFVAMLNDTVTGMSDGSVIPSLNFVPTRINDNGRVVPNTANINTVTNDIKKEIDAVLTGKTGVIAQVTDGDYTLSKYFTEEQMTTLVDKAVEIIKAKIRTEDNAIALDKAVEYATPDTMKADVRAFIEGYYYAAVLDIVGEDTEAKLYIQTVTSKTDSSIEMLVQLRMDAYGDVDAANKYETYVKLMHADVDLDEAIKGMNNTLKAAYGDVSDALASAYLKAFAITVLGKDKDPAVGTQTRVELVEDPESETGTKEVKIALKTEIADVVAAKLLDNVNDLDVLVAEVEPTHALYEFPMTTTSTLAPPSTSTTHS